MAALFVMVTLALGSAALLFRTAHEQVYFRTTWAVDACSASQMFCSHPEYLTYAEGCTLILAIGRNWTGREWGLKTGQRQRRLTVPFS